MCNWKRVAIFRSSGNSDVPSLRKSLTMAKDYSNFHCLIYFGGISGLSNWAGDTSSVVGNLATQDFDKEGIAETLIELSVIAPSLTIKVHIGKDNEGSGSVAMVLQVGSESCIVTPGIETIPYLNASRMNQNLL